MTENDCRPDDLLNALWDALRDAPTPLVVAYARLMTVDVANMADRGEHGAPGIEGSWAAITTATCDLVRRELALRRAEDGAIRRAYASPTGPNQGWVKPPVRDEEEPDAEAKDRDEPQT